MFFVNLSLAEFLALFTAVSAAVVALYMLDRSRRRLTVATLRFWNPAQHPVETTRRRRIRQWASLLLQIAGIACLLLALAQLRWGRPDAGARDHVLILDTSAWMGARTSQGPLIDRARAAATAYLRAAPAADRIMIVYADALATPVTPFETNRRKLVDI
ncbi:MAG: BatA domain-containing protein, partial [Bryobacteraceae bacterium]